MGVELRIVKFVPYFVSFLVDIIQHFIPVCILRFQD